jgi:NTE family protein/lysophospholipid hydrolase
MYPTGTRKWLEPRDVDAHYHVQLGNALLFRRMARRLTDNAVGLVLSGGGARGFAHVGAFRAIDEANLEIDVIGCSSMGALLGALFATGHNSEDIIAIAKKHEFPKGLMDYTFPHTALVKSQALTEWLQDTYVGIDVEDLWQPFFSVSANLTQASQVVHTQGPLWEAVRASMAIPAVFSPLCRRGEILVDGGIMNNLPIDVMRDFCANGQIIALNASPEKEPDTDFDFTPSISGWKILWSKLNVFAQATKIPSLAEIVLRTMEVNSASKAKQSQQEADVFIQMATQKFGLLDFAEFHEIIECGYESSKPHIDALKQQMERLDSIEP